MKWMKQFAPEYASTMTYDAYLESPDELTRIPTLAGYVPLHRIAMNDPAGTEYYVSEKSNDIVQKTDRRGRILAYSGYIIHNLFFFRQRTWWTPFLDFIAWTAMLMVVTGVVVGIWRVALKPRFRHKGVLSYTPYSGWMKWHHYAGLIFGLFSISWILSGMIPISTFPIPGWTRCQSASKAMARVSSWGTPVISPRSSMTKDMAHAITGGPLNLQPLQIENVRNAIGKIQEKFAPKELELIQFRGEPYFLAYQPPTTKEEAEHWTTNNAINAVNLPQDNPHLFVSISHPENGVMASFSKEVMEQASREAMPNVPVIDSEWLTDYDNYYHQTTTSFELGRHKPAYVLPVLRVRYNDRKPDLALFHAVPRPDGEVRQARSREPMGLLRSACDGLAGPVQSPAVVGHRDDRIVVRPCGDKYHDAVARLPPAEAARGPWLEMGVPAEKAADCSKPGMGYVRPRSHLRRLTAVRILPAESAHRSATQRLENTDRFVICSTCCSGVTDEPFRNYCAIGSAVNSNSPGATATRLSAAERIWTES